MGTNVEVFPDNADIKMKLDFGFIDNKGVDHPLPLEEVDAETTNKLEE